MSQRLRSIRRILAVQEQLLRIAEWKLVGIERQAADVGEAQRELERFLERGQPLAGRLLTAVTGQRRKLAERRAALEAERIAQQQRVLQASRSRKLAEDLEESVDESERRHREKAELAELIERAVKPPGPFSS